MWPFKRKIPGSNPPPTFDKPVLTVSNPPDPAYLQPELPVGYHFNVWRGNDYWWVAIRRDEDRGAHHSVGRIVYTLDKPANGALTKAAVRRAMLFCLGLWNTKQHQEAELALFTGEYPPKSL